jgi:hypothetical protein
MSANGIPRKLARKVAWALAMATASYGVEALWEGQKWMLDGFHRLTVAIGRTVAGTFSTAKREDAIRAADTPPAEPMLNLKTQPSRPPPPPRSFIQDSHDSCAGPSDSSYSVGSDCHLRSNMTEAQEQRILLWYTRSWRRQRRHPLPSTPLQSTLKSEVGSSCLQRVHALVWGESAGGDGTVATGDEGGDAALAEGTAVAGAAVPTTEGCGGGVNPEASTIVGETGWRRDLPQSGWQVVLSQKQPYAGGQAMRWRIV